MNAAPTTKSPMLECCSDVIDRVQFIARPLTDCSNRRSDAIDRVQFIAVLRPSTNAAPTTNHQEKRSQRVPLLKAF